VAKVCAFSALLRARVSCGIRIGEEVCWTGLSFFVVFHREWSVEAVGVRPCRNVWMLAFLC
jgi:hypothetical protein